MTSKHQLVSVMAVPSLIKEIVWSGLLYGVRHCAAVTSCPQHLPIVTTSREALDMGFKIKWGHRDSRGGRWGQGGRV